MADWVALIELLALSDTKRGVETGILTSFRFGEKYGFWRDLEGRRAEEGLSNLKR